VRQLPEIYWAKLQKLYKIGEMISKLQRDNLTELRNLMLRQHKTLLEVEKAAYEILHGPLLSKNQLLSLLLSHEHFAWLRRISGLVAKIDETLDSRKPIPDLEVENLFTEIRSILTATEEGEGFGQRYFDAMQQSPDAIVTHGEMVKRLTKS
jgi:hypothetical protein